MKKMYLTLSLALFLMGSVPAAKADAVSVTAPQGNLAVRTFKKMNDACERFLTNENVPSSVRKIINVAGHIIPVFPTLRSFSDPDKFNFLLVEGPVMGAVTTPAAVTLANALMGRPLIDSLFFKHCFESFISYQGANVFRNGVNVDSRLSNNVKAWLNWWYSAAVYATVTAGPVLVKATTPNQRLFAYGLIAVHMIWPLFSQRMTTYVWTPLLFSKFPKFSLLDKIHSDPKWSADLAAKEKGLRYYPTDELINGHLDKIIELGVKAGETAEKIDAATDRAERKKLAAELKKTRTELGSLQAELKWIRWFREGLGEGEKVPSGRKFQYWAQKTGVSMGAAAMMLTLYFIQRWVLAGTSSDDEGLLQRLFKVILRQVDPKAQVSTEVLQQVPDVVRSLAEDMRRDPELFKVAVVSTLGVMPPQQQALVQ